MTNPGLITIFTAGNVLLFPRTWVGNEDNVKGISHGVILSSKSGGNLQSTLLLYLIHATSIYMYLLSQLATLWKY